LSVLVFNAAPGHDTLTGLPDRAAFVSALRTAAEAGDGVAVLFLDLDDFKVVNDGFGHEAGDRLLIQVAQRLKAAVREHDLVARLGGDEFTILCRGTNDPSIAAGRLRGAL
jgi:diguanylate cyclase (GGDEF)-like protein